MKKSHRPTRNLLQITSAAQQLLQAAKRRPRLKDTSLCTYELAKAAQTSERDLPKAAMLYVEAARKGEKIDSCLKDFASILHQMGSTDQAISFLKEARGLYRGDLQKYDRLLTTLQKQLQPSGKHHCKSILLEFPDPVEPTPAFLETLFSNTTRIKMARAYVHLDFQQPPSFRGRWVVLDFDSFSAAKKTLEKFEEKQWFGVGKFWLRGGLVVCLATDGREDFQKGVVMGKQELEVRAGGSIRLLRVKGHRLDLLNRLSIGCLQGAVGDDHLAD